MVTAPVSTMEKLFSNMIIYEYRWIGGLISSLRWLLLCLYSLFINQEFSSHVSQFHPDMFLLLLHCGLYMSHLFFFDVGYASNPSVPKTPIPYYSIQSNSSVGCPVLPAGIAKFVEFVYGFSYFGLYEYAFGVLLCFVLCFLFIHLFYFSAINSMLL